MYSGCEVSGVFVHVGDESSLQAPFDVAVVTPSVLRPALVRAIRSVVEQDFSGRIQMLVGVDKPSGSLDGLISGLGEVPPSRVVSFLDPGYSTSVLHPGGDGGVLRCVLTYLANARFVAYLDDENWWAADHLSRLRRAIEGKAWAFAHRFFTHPKTGRVICRDDWESVGPDRGVFEERGFGGWVDPNCLMIDKIVCEPVIRKWSIAMDGDPRGRAADRGVFQMLRQIPWGEVDSATVFYQVDPEDAIHAYRLLQMGAAWDDAARPAPEAVTTRDAHDYEVPSPGASRCTHL